MPSFAQPQPKEKLGKIDRWLVNYLSLASVAFVFCYVCTNVWGKDIYTESIVAGLVSILILKAIMVPTVHSFYRDRGMIFLGLLLMVAVVNVIFSRSIEETGLRWMMWFSIVVSMARVSTASEGTWVDALIRRLPVLFFMIYAAIVAMGRYLNPGNELSSFHLSGLYGNLILATGLFAAKAWQRIMWSVIGLIAIYFSGAGGALFTIPIMLVPYILYSTRSMPVKGLALASLFMLGLMSFFGSHLFSSFLNIKVLSYTDSSYTGLDRLERSGSERLELIDYGLLIARENPMGTGLGHTYYEDMQQGSGVVHPHDGSISMLIELGVPGFAITASLMLWMFLCIFRNSALKLEYRSFYFTYFFTLFGRSLSENYTPLDLGNYFNFIFLLFSAYLFLNRKTQRRPMMGPLPNRGRMMMRPGLRPSLPRPVGVQ